MEAITENQHATTKDAQLDHFIAKAISRGDPQVGEIDLGDLHFRREAVAGDLAKGATGCRMRKGRLRMRLPCNTLPCNAGRFSPV